MSRRIIFAVILLSASLVSISSPPVSGPPTIPSIPNFGVIQYPESTNGTRATWMKTVTWADSTQDDIKVDDKGRIYVNNHETTAFGLNIATGGDVGDDGASDATAANLALDWLQEKGVRFMILEYYHKSEESNVLFWLPKLYAHKMFVLYFIKQEPANNIDPTTQYNHFKKAIDAVDNQNWADTIYAVGMCAWELNIWHDGPALETYFSSLKPQCASYLSSSLIGDVPLLAKFTVGGATSSGAIAITKWSDIPCADHYPNDYDPDDYPEQDAYSITDLKSSIDSGMNQIFNTNLPEAGKSGYNVWLTEAGQAINRKVEGQGTKCPAHVDPGYFPEVFEYNLAGGTYGRISNFQLWALYSFDEDFYRNWGAFYRPNGGQGIPGQSKSWITKLAPYFPAIAEP